MIFLKIISRSDGVRIDVYLAEQLNKSRAFVKKMFDEELVSVNGKKVKSSQKVKIQDEINYELPKIVELNAKPQDIPLDVRYEDRYLLVVNKPKGMVVHPAPGNPENTLVNAVMAHCRGKLSAINSVMRPGIVHRIDKDTSGLLVIAKDDKTHLGLSSQLKDHSMTRVYRCIVNGRFKSLTGTVNAPIGRNPNNRKKMAVTMSNCKDAVTQYEVLEELNGFSYVKCVLETGRTHQIRVHMSYLGHPLLGDELYGDRNKIGVKGQVLHAGVLGFVHPITGEYLEFSSELPEEFEKILEKLRM